MTAHQLYVGLDGGGSGTTVVVHDRAGHERARLEGPATLVRPGRAATVADTIDRLVRTALGEAGAGPPAEALVCALAGAGREAERAAVEEAVARRGLARAVRVTTDAEAALFDAFGDGAGLVLVAGTGSVAWGRAEDGRAARVGGWGAVMGDEGGGYAIGRAALRAVARARDGRGPETRLTAALIQAGPDPDSPAAISEVADVRELVAWTDGAGKRAIARLAPAVIRVAEAGDGVAREIVAHAARELADHIRVLHGALEPWDAPAPVALSGGLAVPGRPLRPHVLAAIDRLELPVDVRDTEVDGARGAAGMAWGAAKMAADGSE